MKYLVIEVQKGKLFVYRSSKPYGKLITARNIDTECLVATNTDKKLTRVRFEIQDIAHEEIFAAIANAIRTQKNIQ